MPGKVQVYSAKPPFEQKALLETGPITNHVNFVNNRNGKFAYVTIGGLGAVKVFRRGPAPELIATIPVGDLPHGIWPSGDGSRVYVALENAVEAAVIDTLTNRVIANVPIGQTSQALVYVPNAVPAGDGTDNLVPLGEAGNTARLRLEAGGTALPDAQGWVAVNSLGLLDLVQLAAEGLTPKSQYQVYLAESDSCAFREARAVGCLEDESRRSRNRSSDRSAKDARCRWRCRERRTFAEIPYCHRTERPDPGGATAQEIESLVLMRLKKLLLASDQVVKLFTFPTDDVATTRVLVESAQRIAKQLEVMPAKLRELFRAIAFRVMIHNSSMELQFRKRALRAYLLGTACPTINDARTAASSEKDLVTIRVEATVKRCGGETRLVIPGTSAPVEARQPALSLLRAVARGHEWVRLLEGRKIEGSASRRSLRWSR